MSIHAEGSDIRDIANKLGLASRRGDVTINFRSADFGRRPLPGMRIYVSADSCRNREFTTIEAAISYLRKLHRAHLKGGK